MSGHKIAKIALWMLGIFGIGLVLALVYFAFVQWLGTRSWWPLLGFAVVFVIVLGAGIWRAAFRRARSSAHLIARYAAMRSRFDIFIHVMDTGVVLLCLPFVVYCGLGSWGLFAGQEEKQFMATLAVLVLSFIVSVVVARGLLDMFRTIVLEYV